MGNVNFVQGCALAATPALPKIDRCTVEFFNKHNFSALFIFPDFNCVGVVTSAQYWIMTRLCDGSSLLINVTGNIRTVINFENESRVSRAD